MKDKELRLSDKETDSNYRWVNTDLSDRWRIITYDFPMEARDDNTPLRGSAFALQKRTGRIWISKKYFSAWDRALRIGKEIANQPEKSHATDRS